MCELSAAGDRVIGICLENSRADEYLRAHGISTEYLPAGPPWLPGPVRALRRLIRQCDADAVHVHFHRDIWTASLALRGDHRRRLLLGIYLGVPKKNDPLHRLIYGRVDAIVTSSKELCRRLPSLYPVSPGKIHYLPYGRRMDAYVSLPEHRKQIRSVWGIGENELLVGTMVRIDPGKGVGDFVASFEHLDAGIKSRVRYLIVGEPTRLGRPVAGQSPYEPHCVEYLHSLEQAVASHGLEGRVRFAGYQSDYIGYLSAFDVFVFPSRDELYSLVVLDALAMGLPVVAAAAGGTLDQIQDGRSGLLYPVGDPAALAAQVCRYANDPSLRLKHGREGRMFVETHHAMDSTLDSLRIFYGRGQQPNTVQHSHETLEHPI